VEEAGGVPGPLASTWQSLQAKQRCAAGTKCCGRGAGIDSGEAEPLVKLDFALEVEDLELD
jgi:hypothetical protein